MAGDPGGRRPPLTGWGPARGSAGGTEQTEAIDPAARVAELERDRDRLRRSVAAMEGDLDTMARQEAVQRALAESNPTLAVVADRNGVVVHQGAGPGRILRSGASTLVGAEFGDLVHPEDRPLLVDGLRDVVGGGAGERRVLILRLNRNYGGDGTASASWRTCETVLINRLDDGRLHTGGEETGGILIASHDVTPWAEAAARLHTAQMEAERAAKAKADLLAIMSHEIRTPLNGVIGTVRLLLDTALDPEQRDHVRTALDSGEMLVALLNDILDLSKAEAGQMVLEARPLEPRRVVSGVLKLLDGRARARGDRLVAEVADDVPTWVTGDPTRLRQVLLNLVDNAVKFTRDGSVTVSVAAEGPDALVFAVSDSGEGISPEGRERLFSAFAQADASITRRHGGTGLGLSVCKALVDQWGGTIGLDSEPGQGSRFRFSLPCTACDPPEDAEFEDEDEARSDDEPAEAAGTASTVQHADANAAPSDEAAASTASASSVEEAKAGAGELAQPPALASPALAPPAGDLGSPAPDFYGSEGGSPAAVESAPPRSHPKPVIKPAARPLKVLLVEDNPINQKIARGLLERLGHKVSLATDGDVAVEAAATGRYDAVLMDIHMPDVDGFEATRRIRALKDRAKARIPIVAMTADAGQGEAERCKAAGMDGYVPKPIDPSLLRRVLDRVGTHPAAPQARPVFAAQNRREPRAADGVFDPEAIDALAAQVGMAGVPALIDEFTRHASHVLQTLQDALERDDVAPATQAAHELKGMTLSFGLVGLNAVVVAVEAACKADDLETARTEAGRLGAAAVEGVSRLRAAYPLRAARAAVSRG